MTTGPRKAEPTALLGALDSGEPDPTEDAFEVPVLSCAERMLMVMGEIGNVPKDDYNQSQQFHYRGVEKVVAATRDAMIKYRLLCVPKSVQIFTDYKKPETTRTATLKIVYEFLSADDPEDTVEVEVASEANDNGDKAVSKAMTAAHKAVLLQAFQIGDSGTDQDTSDNGGSDEPDWMSESDIETLKIAIDGLSDESRRTLRTAWTPRWGSLARGRVSLDVSEEILSLVALLAEQDASGPVTAGS